MDYQAHLIETLGELRFFVGGERSSSPTELAWRGYRQAGACWVKSDKAFPIPALDPEFGGEIFPCLGWVPSPGESSEFGKADKRRGFCSKVVPENAQAIDDVRGYRFIHNGYAERSVSRRQILAFVEEHCDSATLVDDALALALRGRVSQSLAEHSAACAVTASGGSPRRDDIGAKGDDPVLRPRRAADRISRRSISSSSPSFDNPDLELSCLRENRGRRQQQDEERADLLTPFEPGRRRSGSGISAIQREEAQLDRAASSRVHHALGAKPARYRAAAVMDLEVGALAVAIGDPGALHLLHRVGARPLGRSR